MTASNKVVEGQQPGNPQSGKKTQATVSSPNRKPAQPRAQAKSATTKSPAKASTSSSSQSKSTKSDSLKLKDNAARAETLEHENVAVQNKRASDFNTDSTDVSGVIVTSDREEMNKIEQDRSMIIGEEEKHRHKKGADKHPSKDKKGHLLNSDAKTGQDSTSEVADPQKKLDTLQRKALKSEKKVNKLKKKVHKAEKKEVKPSKLRALKEKLTKVFAKWQRRKKRVDEAGK